MMRTLFYSGLLFFLTCHNLGADVAHDESVSGDLSDDGLNPTPLTFIVGENDVIGSTTNVPLDRDVWTISIASGQQLDSITLLNYDTTEDASFFAVEAGSQITTFANSGSLLGNSLIGSAVGAQQGDDVLDDLGNAQFGGTGFSGPLGPGQYTFWFQETAATTNYSFRFNVSSAVPEPASASLIALGISFVVLRRQRRS